MNTTNCISNRGKKVIGIIGGSGPEAGADLFRKVLVRHRTKLGSAYTSDRDAPDIVLMSVSGLGGPRTAIDIDPGNTEGTYQESLQALVSTVQKMAPLVDFFCLACNTLHVFEPQIRETLTTANKDPSVFISMLATTTRICKARLANGDAKISILGGPATMDLAGNSSFRPLVEQLGEDAIYVPPPSATSVLQRIIWQIKEEGRAPTSGQALDEYKDLLRDIASHRVTICVLACTELPLIDVESLDDLPLEFIDPTEVIADALLEATHIYPDGND